VIIITGENFFGATSVQLAGRVASFRVLSDSQITVTTPVSQSGEATLRVETPFGAVNGTENFIFTQPGSPPAITNVVPRGGGTRGGTRVSIVGSKFSTASKLEFGNLSVALSENL
jgi:hypothetical protein